MPLIWITRKTTSNKDCHRLVVKLESVLKYIDSVWKYLVIVTKISFLSYAINQFSQIQSHNYMLSLNNYIVLLHYNTTSIHIVHNCYSATCHPVLEVFSTSFSNFTLIFMKCIVFMCVRKHMAMNNISVIISWIPCSSYQ